MDKFRYYTHIIKWWFRLSTIETILDPSDRYVFARFFAYRYEGMSPPPQSTEALLKRISDEKKWEVQKKTPELLVLEVRKTQGKWSYRIRHKLSDQDIQSNKPALIALRERFQSKTLAIKAGNKALVFFNSRL